MNLQSSIVYKSGYHIIIREVDKNNKYIKRFS